MIGILVAGSIISLVTVLFELVRTSGSALAWLAAVETIINDVVYVGIAMIFLWLLPGHLELRRILGELHRLRSLAHVIDMHQLTKDPERFAAAFRPTSATVEVGLTPMARKIWQKLGLVPGVGSRRADPVD